MYQKIIFFRWLSILLVMNLSMVGLSHASKLPDSDQTINKQAESNTYTTKLGDVLGKVAQKYQPQGVKLKDVANAIYQSNKSAFNDNNPNKLKIGSTIHIPKKFQGIVFKDDKYERVNLESTDSSDNYIIQSGDVLGKIAQKYQPAGTPLKEVVRDILEINKGALKKNRLNKLIIGQTIKIPNKYKKLTEKIPQISPVAEHKDKPSANESSNTDHAAITTETKNSPSLDSQATSTASTINLDSSKPILPKVNELKTTDAGPNWIYFYLGLIGVALLILLIIQNKIIRNKA